MVRQTFFKFRFLLSYLGEEADGPGVVHAGREDEEEVVQHHGLVVQVELDGLVVQLDVGHLGDDVLEVGLAPGLCGVGHHGQHGVVVLLVLVVQEHQLGPQVSLFGGAENLERNEKIK